MKKFLLVFCLAFGTAIAANAQTSTAANTDAAVKADSKSCCATMAEAVEKNCVEAYKASEKGAEAAKSDTPPAGVEGAAAAAPKGSSCCAAKAAQAGNKPCAGKATAQAANEKEAAEKEN